MCYCSHFCTIIVLFLYRQIITESVKKFFYQIVTWRWNRINVWASQKIVFFLSNCFVHFSVYHNFSVVILCLVGWKRKNFSQFEVLGSRCFYSSVFLGQQKVDFFFWQHVKDRFFFEKSTRIIHWSCGLFIEAWWKFRSNKTNSHLI